MSLRIERLGVSYAQRIAVHPSSVELAAGCMVALVGPNGAGKSSMLKAIAGLVDNSGEVFWQQQPIANLSKRARAKTLAYLPQATSAHWPMTVRDLVGLGRLPYREFSAGLSPADEEAIHWAMQQTEILELAARSVNEISGGEYARVQLARALAVRAPVLLVDEPVASLDPYHQLQIMSLLEAYAADHALVVAVLHDLSLAARFCKRMLLMHEGQVVEDGTPEAVLRDDSLRKYYRVYPYLSEHEGQPLIVPWRRLD